MRAGRETESEAMGIPAGGPAAPGLARLPRAGQWALLLVGSAAFAAVLQAAGLPAALLLGPMIAWAPK